MESFLLLNSILSSFVWEWNALSIFSVSIASFFVLVFLAYLVLHMVYSYQVKARMGSLELNTSDTRIIAYNLKDKTIRLFDIKYISNF